MRKEDICKLLVIGKTECGESQVTCINFDPDNCPKSRNKNRITTACWRVKTGE